MPLRLLLLFVTISICPVINALEIISDSLVSASVNPRGPLACDAEGRLYLGPSGNPWISVIRASPDGSTLAFQLPASEDRFEAFTHTPTGLAILAVSDRTPEGASHRMYRFDNQGNIITRRPVAIDFSPFNMVLTSSGKMVVVGESSWIATQESGNYVGAVLDADDQVIQVFKFPLGSDGTQWSPVRLGLRSRMLGGDGIAYMIASLGTGVTRSFALATIAESGHIDIDILPVPPNSETRYHNEWLFGPGIVVESYHYIGEKPRTFDRFDEFDLGSRKKIVTKKTLGAGFEQGCYLGDTFSYLASPFPPRPHGDRGSKESPPERHRADIVRFVTVKVE